MVDDDGVDVAVEVRVLVLLFTVVVPERTGVALEVAAVVRLLFAVAERV